MYCNDVRTAMRCVDEAIFQTSLIVPNFFRRLPCALFLPRHIPRKQIFRFSDSGSDSPATTTDFLNDHRDRQRRGCQESFF
jgi:hypothetical protein